MINSLEITNLQSHKYSLLEFHKGVNIIKGRSHSGKSSIVRALIWALQNKPSGFHFKSHFSEAKENTEVSIEFENGEYISRIRNNTFNGYTLSGNENGLEALRTDLPDEIKAITRMNDINIHSQGDKYFMLQETPGTVAKELNSIVGLDIIDEVNKKVTRIVDASTAKHKQLSTDIKDKKEEIKKYKHLKDAEKLIKKIDSLVESGSILRADAMELESIRTKIESAQDDIDNINEWLKVEKPFKAIKKKQEDLIQLQSKELSLSSWLNEYKKLQITSVRINEVLSLEKGFKKTKSILNKLSEMRLKHDKILKLYTDIGNTEKSLNLSSECLGVKLKEKAELLKSHEDEFCSKCGSHRQYWRKK